MRYILCGRRKPMVTNQLAPRRKHRKGIQDSGFSTDAASTSSKESSSTTPSATHSTGVVHGPGPGQGANVALDELWSLLDVIHRKGTRLRDEAQQLQQQQASSWTPGDQLPIQASNEQNGIHLQNGGAEASRLRIALDEALRQRDALDQELRKLRLSSNEEQYEKDREDDEKKLEEEISSRILDDALGPLQLPLKVEPPDRNWVKAVLLENSALSLKRHLLNALANNKTLLHRLEISDRARRVLEDTIAKYREEVDDLHFQLEEKNIELEGTRARIRILENKTINRYSSSTNVVLHGKDITHNDGFKPISNSNQGQLIVVKTPASPYSSSTESAHDVDTNHNGFNSTSPKHRPSRIPLPGHSRTASTTPSKLNVSPNRSLSRDSCRSASSIPIAKTPHTTMRNLSSPVPRLKRDSLTGRIRNHDSLSRVREKNLISSNKNVSTLHKNAGSNTHLVSDKVRQQKMPFWSNWFKMLDSGGQ
ncbi:uncharacterized protein LOC113385679 [Ctenocephalides felis]|uniref:uncharacterized protein LOC113385679 n=1 Tax=Ctenocephalides felis TaxID=7515 RepID=UPI000E6E33AA|nr:uncharacterized protein LOC113385679 [Ctenocephalides felis]